MMNDARSIITSEREKQVDASALDANAWLTWNHRPTRSINPQLTPNAERWASSDVLQAKAEFLLAKTFD